MDTARLKKFAQYARRALIEQTGMKMRMALAADGPARRENPSAVAELEKRIKADGAERVVETAAYTWFNRFCALRFMDAAGYNRVGIVSPAAGQTQPEMLAEAKMGHIDDAMVPEGIKRKALDLLSGAAPSREPQAEAYRMLVTACCNHYHRQMPFLFEKIADYTELLMPDDLLSENSVLAAAREAMRAEDCADVEVIGWLYQFYISEKKDEVFEGLKKNKKITPENIPAATQLFTPAWIVKYLVENSLGRLWMRNRPGSKLRSRMEYYIDDGAAGGGDFIKIASPEEIKICDPACGSGHMLVYAFDLLYDIYAEEGYDPSEIACKILKNNLYGVEIDGRAGALASFALAMKARGRYRRYFADPVQPNICVLENIRFDKEELDDYMAEVGRDLFTANLEITLKQFEECDNFGSLIRPALTNAEDIIQILHERGVEEKLFILKTHEKVLKVLKQADYLGPKYHVVIANPPYMGGKGMNDDLKSFVQKNYPDSKTDLFAMFIERNGELAMKNGSVAMITMQSWMFLSSFEKLRSNILENQTILSMAHLGARAFDTIGGEVVSTTAFVIGNIKNIEYKGSYIRLTEGNSESEKLAMLRSALPTSENSSPSNFYRASSSDFKKIPGSPIAYWVSDIVRNIFEKYNPLYEFAPTKQGLATGDNDKFLRYWNEVSKCKIKFGVQNRHEAVESGIKWFPCNKGGEFRKWFGNNYYVVNWLNDGEEIKSFFDNKGKLRSRPQNQNFYFKEGLTWSAISSSSFSIRYSLQGTMFETKGAMCFPLNYDFLLSILGFCNSKLVNKFLLVLSPTLDFHEGPIGKLPIKIESKSSQLVEKAISISRFFWDSYETSWDFAGSPLLNIPNIENNIADDGISESDRSPQASSSLSALRALYASLRARWREMTLEMQKLEEENNRIFIEAYGLSGELTPEVPLKEITLTCNPHYRYGGDKTEEELEAMLLADTMKELISYSAGCMFGRYALDKPGLVLANQGETIEDYLKQIPEPIFPADDDNVIPVLDGEWFPDDITERFYNFLRTAFGPENFDDNLKFIETAIGKDIRKYFTKDFYNDHVKRYKKRPIYWMFTSPKGSFNALIYMHRYRPDTVSVVLNDYLREFKTKLTAQKVACESVGISPGSSASEKTKALKEIDRIKKILAELDEYERNTLYPLATKQIAIDLDDGVRVNYQKFGAALKKIAGLDDKEE